MIAKSSLKQSETALKRSSPEVSCHPSCYHQATAAAATTTTTSSTSTSTSTSTSASASASTSPEC